MAQIIKFYDKPSPHIIIDEFLSPKIARDCLKECTDLEAFYEPAKLQGSLQHLDDCEECQKIKKFERKAVRENDVVFLDTLYKDKRQSSLILRALQDKISTSDIHDLIKNKGFFHILRSVNTSEAILSRYGMCDFYGYHIDTIPSHPLNRVVTIVYYLNHKPEQFTGGELLIAGDTIADFIKVTPQHNRAVIFQSDSTLHSVDTVKLLGDKFKDGRFSINIWLGFDGVFKFK